MGNGQSAPETNEEAEIRLHQLLRRPYALRFVQTCLPEQAHITTALDQATARWKYRVAFYRPADPFRETRTPWRSGPDYAGQSLAMWHGLRDVLAWTSRLPGGGRHRIVSHETMTLPNQSPATVLIVIEFDDPS